MKKFVLLFVASLAFAATPQEKADAAWMVKFHQQTAKVREAQEYLNKVQKERDQFVKDRVADCESRGQQLMFDNLTEPTCQFKLPPATLPPPTTTTVTK